VKRRVGNLSCKIAGHGKKDSRLRGNDSLKDIQGFTLIEMAIALVIIGLVVGGVLVGQDLIRSAEVRATISQIEKYNHAANTFRGKFGFLPGDINAAAAATFGFVSRGLYAGEGDGNGVIQGVDTNSAGHNYSNSQGTGESAMFWVDLSSAAAGSLIDGGFNTASPNVMAGTISGTNLNSYFPPAKLGRGNYVYVYSGGWQMDSQGTPGDSLNYYGLSAVSSITSAQIISSTALTVAQAYNIDKKVDDGFPQSGNVMAMYLTSNGLVWAAGGGATGAAGGNSGPTTTATSGSTTTCYDNGGTTGAPMNYSLEISNGAYTNCALSFRFQ
jgi:prepilin-type N-terminal cleavage/methylation domain-containing protein